MFGRKGATAATPGLNASPPIVDGVATPGPALVEPEPLERDLARLQLQLAHTERVLKSLEDDVLWIKERFDKLQNRVTAELREIRREVDRFFEEEPDDTDSGR